MYELEYDYEWLLFIRLYVWILEYNNVHYFGIKGAYRWEIGGEIVNDMEDDTT